MDFKSDRKGLARRTRFGVGGMAGNGKSRWTSGKASRLPGASARWASWHLKSRGRGLLQRSVGRLKLLENSKGRHNETSTAVLASKPQQTHNRSKNQRRRARGYHRSVNLGDGKPDHGQRRKQCLHNQRCRDGGLHLEVLDSIHRTGAPPDWNGFLSAPDPGRTTPVPYSEVWKWQGLEMARNAHDEAVAASALRL
jgi:hypothetical protein